MFNTNRHNKFLKIEIRAKCPGVGVQGSVGVDTGLLSR